MDEASWSQARTWLWLALLPAAWALCGWALARAWLRVSDGVEAAALALPLGLLAQIAGANVLAHVVPVPVALWACLLGGAACAGVALWRLRGARAAWALSRPARLALVGLLAASAAGVAALGLREVYPDDPAHATMARLLIEDQFPLRFTCNPDLRASYHYGGNLLVAQAQSISRLPPWDALDVTRAALFAAVLSLAFAGAFRARGSLVAGVLAAVLVAATSQARWIDWLALASGAAEHAAAGAPALRPWIAQLPGLLALPFGIGQPGTIPPLLHAHRSLAWGFAPLMILLVLALLELPLGRRTRTLALGLALGLTPLVQLGALAIVAPAVVAAWVLRRAQGERPALFSMAGALVISGALAFGLGGPLTDALADRAARIANPTASLVFGLPPRLPLCRDQAPSLACLLRSLSDAGLAPWLLPWLLALAWRARRAQPARLSLLCGCLVGLSLPLVARYAFYDENLVRTQTYALWTLGALLGAPLAEALAAGGRRRLGALVLVPALTWCGGAFLLRHVLDEATPRVLTERRMARFGAHDRELAPLAPRLPRDARVFDPMGCGTGGATRPGLLFGRYCGSARDRLDSAPPGQALRGTPAFAALFHDPTPEGLRRAGFTHVYADGRWRGLLGPRAAALSGAGFELLGAAGNGLDWRALLRVCAPDESCAAGLPAAPQRGP